MSDEQNVTDEPGDSAATDETVKTTDTDAAEQADESARRPSPGATAASRARRIGGRPMPTPAAREAQRASAPAKGDEPQPAKKPKQAKQSKQTKEPTTHTK